MRATYRRYGAAMAAWLPFSVIWVFFAMSYANATLPSAILTSVGATGSAAVLGLGVSQVCARWPWPLRLTAGFYLLHALLAAAYALSWNLFVCWFEAMRSGASTWALFGGSRVLGWQLLTGVWIYGLFAGVSYAVQTRDRLHEKETLAIRAEALASAARLDAIRARLNPHFLFNALHTLAALVKFRPEIAESAIERLGDMLRYTLKEDGRELVEFSEEYGFMRQYIAFEQLRYEDRLTVNLEIDPASFDFELPPFSMQTLAENAVRHAIAVRPEGGSIWIGSSCKEGKLTVIIRDDGPGENQDAGPSHQFGLRSLRERLRAAFGTAADLYVQRRPEGFEARLVVPAPAKARAKG